MYALFDNEGRPTPSGWSFRSLSMYAEVELGKARESCGEP
jgi:hypothetical protein